MNRTDRLVALVMFLQGRRVVRAEEMAGHFGVTIRTIYRDLAALGEAGVPIAGEAGVGYTLLRGYHLPPVMVTAEEATALFLGAEMVRKFTDASLAGAADAAMLKIRSVLPRDRQDELDRLAAGTAIARPCDGAPEVERRVLLPLQQAIVGRRVVGLVYRDGEGTATEREVEPLGVTYFSGAWYLVAWCRLRGGFRHFKIERVTRFEVRRERYVPRPDFSLREHLRHQLAPATATAIRLRVEPAAMPRMRREAGPGATWEPADAGATEVAFRSSTLDWVPRWVLSFGGTVEVLAPDELRAETGALAAEIAARHAAPARRDEAEEFAGAERAS